MVNNKPFFLEFVHFVKPEYFEDETERLLHEIIVDHSTQFNAQANVQVLENQIYNRNGVGQDTIDEAREYIDDVIKLDHIPIQSTDWLSGVTEKWCQNRALDNAIFKAVHVVQGNDDSITRDALPDLMREALTITKTVELGHDYFGDQEGRWETIHRKTEKIPFDIEILNLATKGGAEKGTLNCVMAGTGVGKTIFLCHMAANAIRQGKNVVYFTCEMAEVKIGERIDANLLDIELNDLYKLEKDEFLSEWKKHAKLHNLQKKSYGQLIIKQYPTATAHVGHFRHFLEELKLRKLLDVDMIIVDYLNICCSSRIRMGSGVNTYSYIKAIAEELRGLAVEYDIPCWTATQVNRAGMDSSDFDMSDTSESVGLPHTLDFFLALIATEDFDKKKRIIAKQLKNRYNDLNYPCRRFLLGLDRSRMKFFHVDDYEYTGDIGKDKKEKKVITRKNQEKRDKEEKENTLFDISTGGAYMDAAALASNPNAFEGVTF